MFRTVGPWLHFSSNAIHNITTLCKCRFVQYWLISTIYYVILLCYFIMLFIMLLCYLINFWLNTHGRNCVETIHFYFLVPPIWFLEVIHYKYWRGMFKTHLKCVTNERNFLFLSNFWPLLTTFWSCLLPRWRYALHFAPTESPLNIKSKLWTVLELSFSSFSFQRLDLPTFNRNWNKALF